MGKLMCWLCRKAEAAENKACCKPCLQEIARREERRNIRYDYRDREDGVDRWGYPTR